MYLPIIFVYCMSTFFTILDGLDPVVLILIQMKSHIDMLPVLALLQLSGRLVTWAETEITLLAVVYQMPTTVTGYDRILWLPK